MGKIAYLFPGQGSQKVGMAKDFFDASETVQERIQVLDRALDVNLSAMMFEGPEEALRQTQNTQPAILIHSLLAYEALINAGAPQPMLLRAIRWVSTRHWLHPVRLIWKLQPSRCSFVVV